MPLLRQNATSSDSHHSDRRIGGGAAIEATTIRNDATTGVDAATMAYFAGIAPTNTNAELMTNLCFLGGGSKKAAAPMANAKNVNDADDDADLLQMVHLSMGLPPTTSTTKSVLSRNGYATTATTAATASTAATAATTAVNNTTPSMAADDDDDDLMQMVHLSMGLPPTTSTTKRIASSNGYAVTGVEDNTTTTARVTATTADDEDDDETLRQMIHMATGLPLNTTTTSRHLHHYGDHYSSMDYDAATMLTAARTPSSSASPNLVLGTSPRLSPAMVAANISGAVHQLSSALMLPVAAVVSTTMSLAAGRSPNSANCAADRNSPEAVAARKERRRRAAAPQGIPEEMLGY